MEDNCAISRKLPKIGPAELMVKWTAMLLVTVGEMGTKKETSEPYNLLRQKLTWKNFYHIPSFPCWTLLLRRVASCGGRGYPVLPASLDQRPTQSVRPVGRPDYTYPLQKPASNLIDSWLNVGRQGETSTHFQALSSCDLELWPFGPKIISTSCCIKFNMYRTREKKLTART